MTRRSTNSCWLHLFLAASAALAEDKVDFEKQILPIFNEHCAKFATANRKMGKMPVEHGRSRAG